MSKIDDLKERFPNGLRNETLTVEDVQLMVDAAIEDKGADYVYPGAGSSCHYFDTKDKLKGLGVEVEDDVVPGCIFGHAGSYVGLHLGDVTDDTNSSSVLALFDELNVTYGDPAGAYACRLQDRQDSGDQWGDAKEDADAILHLMRERDVTWDTAAEMYDLG